MKNNIHPMRKRLSVISIATVSLLLSGFFVYHKQNTRQYHSGIKKAVEEKDGDNGALGMMQFFFNARKNITTGNMDYAAMASANALANAAMATSNKTARTMGTGVSAMSWVSLGPSNVGGRTRAILIDTVNDPTHNTLFAAAVSGGIWVSHNAGAWWDSVPGNDQLSSLEACDIAEDKNGTIYVGTGEGFSLSYPGDGFSQAMIGGGIFKSTDKGHTFRVLSATVPSANSVGTWAYVNRIAVDPINPLYVYAATNKGLYGSQDSGATWTLLKDQSNATLSGNSQDVKISHDGKLLVANTGTGITEGYYGYPNGTFLTKLTIFPTSGNGRLPQALSGGRIEFAISPTNPNYVYASDITNGSGVFGGGASAGTGIYLNTTALSGGGHWYEIGPGASVSFDPYSVEGSQDQATYDNALAVSPTNPGYLFLGGTTLWSWQQASPTDTIGLWTSLTQYRGWPYYNKSIHPDEHVITCDTKNTNTIYVGCDGGIYKSIDGGQQWVPENRNYDVTQFVDIEFAPIVSNLPNPNPNRYTEGEGIMGGTQDNGTPYVSGTSFYYEDNAQPAPDFGVGGGDGGRAAISQLNPNVFYVSSDNNSLDVGGNLSTLGATNDAYTKLLGANKGAQIDSMSQNGAQGGGCFYNQIALYENSYDTTTLDRMQWIADSSYPAGATVIINSPNSQYPFPYKFSAGTQKLDTYTIVNPVISKLAVGFCGDNGVWIQMQAINLSITPIWMPIGGPLSKPDAFTGGPGDAVHAIVWSPNGDALFVGTEGGHLFRFSNLDSIQDTSYITGALYGVPNGSAGTVDTNYKCRVISNHITDFGQDILSISVDPKNGNNIMVTLGNYGGTTYVYYITGALGSSPVITPVQGSGATALPPMPVYSSVLHVLDQNDDNPKSALVGTERGIWSTSDITVASPVWTYTSTGMANTLVMGLKQQTRLPWQCNNAADVYAGTHGRGAFVSSTFVYTGIAPVADATVTSNDLKVYPNPMTTQGTLVFNLPASSDVIITVYDITGKVVKTVPMLNQAQGQHLATINTEDLNVGTYIATVTGNNYERSARFIVVK